MGYYIYEAGNCQHCGDYLGTQEVLGGRHREYCDGRCRQAAFRARKAKRNNPSLRSGKSRRLIEREEAQGLHYMRCGCGRGIWSVRGNVQIGAIACTLCNTAFVGK